jgi:hypothetical protein
MADQLNEKARARRRWVASAIAAPATLLLALPALAAAHIERAAYWPNPAPDCSIHPCAGGKVPKPCSLGFALRPPERSTTRVVCKRDSLQLLRRSIHRARRHGYYVRPHDHRRLSKNHARREWRTNKALFRRCRFHEVQPAVTASRNGDTVVVMPGIYSEPESRAKPTDDPRCAHYTVSNGREVGAVSYKYQYRCPNDQNLIAVLGRKPGNKPPPDPPRQDRWGIPDEGPCIRCNLQLLGSGVSPDDVVVEAGRRKAGNGGPSGVGGAKDVGIRADRADGFVLRNLTVRHAKEHGIYVLESDGFLLDRFKAFYNEEYGLLTFAELHGLVENCETVGSGDSGFYPGGPADTGEQRPRGMRFWFNQEFRRCDSHHNLAGFSGTNGNAVKVDHNNFYDNALGFQTDVVTAPGHPGFPGDSMMIEHNNFYSNNFNPYQAGSDVEPENPFPVGTGLWIAGGNNHTVRYNRFWNNWRRGTMLFAVPNAVVCADPSDRAATPGCDPSRLSTSYRNRFYGNIMGVAPNGRVKPNGTDLWWDDFPGNTANCWWGNVATPRRSITTSPGTLPSCDNGKSACRLKKPCDESQTGSVGTGDPANEGELLVCGAGFVLGIGNLPECPWFTTPPKPGSTAAARQESEQERDFASAFRRYCDQSAATRTCKAYAKPRDRR